MREFKFATDKMAILGKMIGEINTNHIYSSETNPDGDRVFSNDEAYSWLTATSYGSMASTMGCSKKLAVQIFQAFWPTANLHIGNISGQGRVSQRKNVRAYIAYRKMAEASR